MSKSIKKGAQMNFQMQGYRLLCAVLLMGIGPFGCASGTNDGFGDAADLERPEAPGLDNDIREKIRNGTVTNDRPEVGRIGGCTATLVAANVAITAAHCMGYGTRTNIGNYKTFTVNNNGQRNQYRVNRYRSFSRGLGANDISILGLATDVPSDVARPAPLASQTPAEGTSLTVFGYGCTVIGRSGDGQKRKATYSQGDQAQHLCPGDSGGPVFNDETGAVARINSGYKLDRGRTDIYGHVPGIYDQVRAQVEEWASSDLPLEGGEPEDDNLKICGRDYDIFEMWTCTGDRAYRHRCLAGGAPVWEACPDGCVSSMSGANDVCKADEDIDTCGDTYRRFTEWICASDDVTILRCNESSLEYYRCENGCNSISGEPDVCTQ
jgi:V8-like Glu-specific endopeptidase